VADRRGDDEQLLAALRDALGEPTAPPEFLAAGKGAYTWRTIDAELAELTYDSAQESLAAAGRRASDASGRTLTFTSAHLTIELAATEDAILGQIIPMQPGLVEVQPGPEKGAETQADAMGCFTVQPVPAGPFRIRCRTPEGVIAATEWLTL